ncbi:MAG: hypothetical protein KGM42_09570 [Hyphomicrobiales bacterium]|nr:hypothetical protein [Hyphomicrobiales bacterium]
MRWPSAVLAALLASAAGAPAAAQEKSAARSVEEGRALLAEHGCNGSCHQSYSADNDPLSLYTRPDRKVVSRKALDSQVSYCVSRLGTMIFPEDMQSVSDALDADYYKFRR